MNGTTFHLYYYTPNVHWGHFLTPCRVWKWQLCCSSKIMVKEFFHYAQKNGKHKNFRLTKFGSWKTTTFLLPEYEFFFKKYNSISVMPFQCWYQQNIPDINISFLILHNNSLYHKFIRNLNFDIRKWLYYIKKSYWYKKFCYQKFYFLISDIRKPFLIPPPQKKKISIVIFDIRK